MVGQAINQTQPWNLPFTVAVSFGVILAALVPFVLERVDRRGPLPLVFCFGRAGMAVWV